MAPAVPPCSRAPFFATCQQGSQECNRRLLPHAVPFLVGTRGGSEGGCPGTRASVEGPRPPALADRSRPRRVKPCGAPGSPPVGGGSGWWRRHNTSTPGPEWAGEAVMVLRAPSMRGGDVNCCATLGGHPYAQSPCADGPDARRPQLRRTGPSRCQRLLAGSLTGALCLTLWGAWMLLIGVRPCVTASLLWR
jgi:hypothetical protein